MQILHLELILIKKMNQVEFRKLIYLNLSNELFLGKLIYQPSPVDEEIKKPLILETLKLALPKKKLNTM